MKNYQEDTDTFLKSIFAREYTFPFVLLLILLAFNRFRPDRIIPGGEILVYFPTVLVGLLLWQWFRANPKEIRNLQTKLFLVFVAVMIIHIPFARNSGFAFQIVKGFIIYQVTSYLFHIQFIDNFFKLDKYIRLYFVFALFFATLGIFGAGRIDIPVLSDENDFCLFINTLIPFAYFLGVEAETTKKKVFYYSTLVLFIFAVIASFSRGGFVGLLAVGIFLFWQSKQKLSLLLITVLLVVAAYFFAPQAYWDEIKTINTQSHQKGTGRERIESWEAGWKMFLDHPVMGVGPGNFGPWLPDYWPEVDVLENRKQKDPMRMWGRVAHSLYFTLLPEMGLIGLVLFLGILKGNLRDYRFICNLYKRKDEILESSPLGGEDITRISAAIRNLYYFSQAFGGAMVGLLATGIFISVLWYDYFWVLTTFWVITFNLARKIETLLISDSNLTKRISV